MAPEQEMDSAGGQIVSANGLEIFYREHGSGEPLILVHGATDTHRLWDPFLPELLEHFRVITPDSRGHGRTINPERYLTYRMMADDLVGLIQALELESPFIFGYSDGGQAALDLGIRYPDLPGALVLGGVWYRFSTEYQQAISEAGFVSPGVVNFEIYQQNAPADWEERIRQDHPHPDPDYPRELLASLAKMWWTPLDYSREDLERIQAPTLILIGEKDEMIPLREAEQLADLIPGAELRVIPDASHSGVLQPGRDTLRIIRDFLTCKG